MLDPDEMNARGSAKPCLQQVDPDKDFAATLALVFPRRRMLRIVIGAKSPLRVFAVRATILQGVNFDVTFEVAAQGEGFAALCTEEGFIGSRAGGDVGLVGLGPMFLHCVLRIRIRIRIRIGIRIRIRIRVRIRIWYRIYLSYQAKPHIKHCDSRYSKFNLSFIDYKMYGGCRAHKHVTYSVPYRYTLLGVRAPLQRIK
jgi:hypothetical protein